MSFKEQSAAERARTKWRIYVLLGYEKSALYFQRTVS